MAELEPTTGAGNNMLVQYPTRQCRTLLEEGEVCFEKLANSAIILEFFRRRLKEVKAVPLERRTLQDHADYDLIVPVNENGEKDYDRAENGRIKLTLRSHLMIYYSDAVIMRLLQLGKPGTEFDLHKRATFAYRKHIGRLIGLKPAYDWNSLPSKKELDFVDKNSDRDQFGLVWLWLAAREHHVAPMSVTTLHQLTSTEGLSDFYSTQTFWGLHLPDAPHGGKVRVKVLRAAACPSDGTETPSDSNSRCTPSLESPGLVGLIAKEVLRDTRITKYDGDFGSRPDTLTFEEFCDRACIQEYGVLLHSSYLWGNSNRFIDYLYTICVGDRPGPDVKRYGKICRMVNSQSTYVAPEAWFPLTVDQVKAYLRYAVLLRESKYTNEQKAAIAQSIAITGLEPRPAANARRTGGNQYVSEITMKVDLGKLDQYPMEFLTVFARCNGIYDFDRMRQHPERLRKAIVAVSDSTSAPLDVTINLSDAFKTHLALLISREGNDGRFDGVDINMARNYAVVTLRRLDDTDGADQIKHQLVYEVICAMRNPDKEIHNTNHAPEVHRFTTQYYRGFLKYLQYQKNQKNRASSSRKRPRS